MKKGVSWIWRLVAVAVLLCALVPVAFSAGAEAATPPSTYLNPLPQYLNASTYDLVINNGVTGISGTARAATGLSVDHVAIQISYVNASHTYYWNGSAFSWTQTAINTTTLVSPWIPQYDFDKTDQLPQISDLTDGYTYTITAWAVDNTFVRDSTGTSISFIYDVTAPVNGNFTAVGNANVSNLSVKWNASTLDSISGVCSDTAPGQIATVQVSIWKDSDDDGLYAAGEYSWDGTAWVNNGATPAIVTASLTSSTSWTLSTTSVAWTHNASYGVCARVIDKASNPASGTGWVYHNFSYAKSITSSSTAPVIIVDTLPAYFQSTSLQAITGVSNASVNKSVNITAVSIQDFTAGGVWNGSGFDITTSSPIWINATAVNGAFDTDRQVDWSFNTSTVPWADGHTYQVTAKAVQNTSATSSGTTTVSSIQTIVCDDTPPLTSTIVIPSKSTYLSHDNASFVFDSLSSISGTCSDAGQLNSVEVAILQNCSGNLSTWSGTGWNTQTNWLSAVNTNSWSLNTAAVTWQHMGNYITEYTIIARGKDSAGNIEPIETLAKFYFDNHLPFDSGKGCPGLVESSQVAGCRCPRHRFDDTDRRNGTGWIA